LELSPSLVQLLLLLFSTTTVPHQLKASWPLPSPMLREPSSTSLLNMEELMAPKRNTTSDLSSSLRPGKTSISTIARTTSPTLRESIYSVTSLLKNLQRWRVLSLPPTLDQFSHSMRTKLYQTTLTGETEELLLQSRTKAHADHAGLSQLLELLRVSTRLELDLSCLYLNSNLLTVQLSTTVVVVDGHRKPWNMLSVTLLRLKATMVILEDKQVAEHKELLK